MLRAAVSGVHLKFFDCPVTALLSFVKLRTGSLRMTVLGLASDVNGP